MSKQSRIRTQELRKAQLEAAARKAKRRRILQVLGGVVILGLVAAIVLVAVRAGNDDEKLPEVSGEVIPPDNLTSSGTIPVGSADAPVVVEIYFDYMCPVCGQFEKANAEELSRLIEDGTVQVELRPLAFLDKFSNGTEYSSRTANDLAAVADAAPDRVWDFHDALYAEQPEENSDGLSDDEIASIAEDAGVPADVVETFGDGTYRPWVASVTQDALDQDWFTGTPTVLIDGEVFDGDLFTTGPLTDAIESAAAG